MADRFAKCGTLLYPISCAPSMQQLALQSSHGQACVPSPWGLADFLPPPPEGTEEAMPAHKNAMPLLLPWSGQPPLAPCHQNGRKPSSRMERPCVGAPADSRHQWPTCERRVLRGAQQQNSSLSWPSGHPSWRCLEQKQVLLSEPCYNGRSVSKVIN